MANYASYLDYYNLFGEDPTRMSFRRFPNHLLSITKDVDNGSLASFWLITRVIYVPLYILGVDYLRTGVWAVSLISLILMSIKFL